MRNSAPRARAIVVTVAALSAAPVSNLRAQQLVLLEGSRVRLSWASLELNQEDWLVGLVSETTSGRRLNLVPEGAEQPTTVLLDASTRLQIHRGRESSYALGAGVGGLLGGAVGGLFFSGGFGGIKPQSAAFEWTQSALLFGAVGAAAGSLVAYMRGHDRWDDVALEDGRLPVPPLNREPPHDPVSLSSIQWWERFPASQTDFSAFLTAHVLELDPLEGIWRAVPQDRLDAETEERFAIVRDRRYADFHYVAVRLVHREGFAPTERSGSIFAAIRREADEGSYGVQFVERASGFRGRVLPAFHTGPAFIVRMLSSPVEEWVKIFP